MITVLPMTDTAMQQSLLCAFPERKEDTARVLQMKDGGQVLGYAAVDLCKNALRILGICVQGALNAPQLDAEQTVYADFLMRAAASYGENHGMTKITTTYGQMNAFFKARGFALDADHAFTPMSTIVKIGPEKD